MRNIASLMIFFCISRGTTLASTVMMMINSSTIWSLRLLARTHENSDRSVTSWGFCFFFIIFS